MNITVVITNGDALPVSSSSLYKQSNQPLMLKCLVQLFVFWFLYKAACLNFLACFLDLRTVDYLFTLLSATVSTSACLTIVNKAALGTSP